MNDFSQPCFYEQRQKLENKHTDRCVLFCFFNRECNLGCDRILCLNAATYFKASIMVVLLPDKLNNIKSFKCVNCVLRGGREYSR